MPAIDGKDHLDERAETEASKPPQVRYYEVWTNTIYGKPDPKAENDFMGIAIATAPAKSLNEILQRGDLILGCQVCNIQPDSQYDLWEVDRVAALKRLQDERASCQKDHTFHKELATHYASQTDKINKAIADIKKKL